MLRTGLWPSLFSSAYCFAYFALTWSQPHRDILLGMAVLTTVGSLALARLPIERLAAGRWCEAFFLSWSASAIGTLAYAVALDGGAGSPLTPILFLPLVYAALSYPLKSMLAVGALTLGAYVVVALALGGVSVVSGALFGCMLATATWVCAWQALNHARQRAALSEVSRTDPLTECLNRRGFEERFAVELADSRRNKKHLGLVLIDLDRFKAVNDTHGHAAGDELLCWVVSRLSTTLRPRDALGRLGGDEFGVLLPETGPEAPLIRARLIEALSERTGASAGVATFPSEASDEATLHHIADEDLYAAKVGGNSRGHGGQLSWAAALAQIVDRRMASPHQHSQQVAEFAAAIAERLGWPGHEVDRIRLAAMLHDVGKADVPEIILRKPGPLDEREFAVIARHPVSGAAIISEVEGLESIVPWIRHSHERIDGGGYPDGLIGESIPLASRILLVADAFDAMTSDRPYRARLSDTAAVDELRHNCGSQFDPRCVDALIEHVMSPV